jgi:hypothetical protein
MDGSQRASCLADTSPAAYQYLRWRMAEVLAFGKKGASPGEITTETGHANDASCFYYPRAQSESTMTTRMKRDDPATAILLTPGTHQRISEAPASSAANDNQSAWPLAPEDVSSSFRYEQVTSPVETALRSSWRATCGRVAYIATVAIAMLAWFYLLWLVVSSVAQLLN